MLNQSVVSCTAFGGRKRIASGSIRDVVLRSKEALDRNEQMELLIFDDETSTLVEVDFRGTAAQVVQRIDRITGGSETSDAPSDVKEGRRPGRPRLGVVAREVTLLPRHWDWLAGQPGGASVALRKLVEHGMKANRDRDCLRRAQEATYRFVSAMAGNEPGYEEAIRALFGGHEQRFHEIVEPWPADIRDHAKRLAAAAFGQRAPA